MTVPRKIADVKFNWHIEPIDFEGTYEYANMKLVFDKPLINGVECEVDMTVSTYDGIKSAIESHSLTMMATRMQLDDDVNKPLGVNMFDGSVSFTVTSLSTSGNYVRSNLVTSFANDHIETEGIIHASWNGQNSGAGANQANGLAISMSLYNEIRAAAAICIPVLLRTVDLANGRNVALVLD